nr:hypothetical protein CFP56_02701 [Quercus suber]
MRRGPGARVDCRSGDRFFWLIMQALGDQGSSWPAARHALCVVAVQALLALPTRMTAHFVIALAHKRRPPQKPTS